MKMIFLQLTFFSIYYGFAQDRVISGEVKDESGSPLMGVTILEKGTNNGVQTDLYGAFSLNVSQGSILQFSFTGFKTREMTVESILSYPKVVLRVESNVLDEVVVVGYGAMKKSDLTGAVASLKAEDVLKGGVVSNISQAIRGKVAGVVVTQNSNAPGGSLSIRIRGSNSISGSNEPLYVLDGFPSKKGFNINPSDIASIEVLKDASATAVYGSRGANGVVLITTKRGISGKSTISYNGYYGVQNPAIPFDFLNAREYMELANELHREKSGNENVKNGVFTDSQLNSDVDTDWIKITTRMANVQSHGLEVFGGSDKTKVAMTGGYFNQQGVLKNTSFERYSGRVNVDQKVNNYIKAGLSLMAQREGSNFQKYSGNILGSNVLLSILTYNPGIPVYNKDGSFARPAGGKGDNPLANLLSRKNRNVVDKFNGTAYLEIAPLNGLVITSHLGTLVRKVKVSKYLMKSSYKGSIDGGNAQVEINDSSHNLIDVLINYKKEINDSNSFSVMGGYSYETFENSSLNNEVYKFPTDLYESNNLGAASKIRKVGSYRSNHLIASMFGRVIFSMLDRYLFTATVRADGSSRFGSENRWAVFPSGAFSWKVIKEPFMKNLGVFSDLKLRLSYGQTGNQSIGDYLSYSILDNTRYTYNGKDNNTATRIKQNNPENKKLKWETTSQYNLGLDFGLLKNRLTFNLNAYQKKTDDLLMRSNLPSYSGYSSGIRNIGSMSNRGIEFAMFTKNVVGEFVWDTQLNLATNKNSVDKTGEQGDIYISSSKPIGSVSHENYAVIRKGSPLGSLFGYKYLGVLQKGEKYGPQPDSKPGDPKFADINGDGKIDSYDRVIIGKAYPDFTIGVTNNFSYKGFDFSIFIQGVFGNELLNMTRMNLEYSRTRDALKRWTPENINSNIPRNGFYTSKYGGYMVMITDYACDMGLSEKVAPKKMSDFSYGANNGYIEHNWKNMYQLIGNANLLISKVRNVKGMTDREKTLVEGQARFLRALSYRDLTDGWGKVPLILERSKPTTELYNAPLTAVKEIDAQIIKDCKFAIKNLPKKWENGQGVARATKGAALTLLGKIYMRSHDYKNAKKYIDQVLKLEQEGVYQLNPDFKEEWADTNKLDKGMIFGVLHEATLNGGEIANHFGPSDHKEVQKRWQYYAVSLQFWRTYSDKDPRREFFYYNYEGATPRDETTKDGFFYKLPSPGETKAPDKNTKLLKNLATKKYSYGMVSDSYYDGRTIQIFRLADVILCKAEIENELTGPAVALTYLNRIRNRAGAPEYGSNNTSFPTPSSKEMMRDYILDERGFELVFEYHRRADLIRLGKFVDKSNEYLKKRGLKEIVRDELKYFPYPLTEATLHNEMAKENIKRLP
ncbi:membrane receptor RagA [Elysia marginata]|uniref:Membrane receptor RagA n=1 Tax=Elysia marginata TaxID=1093978 RepID=A0AAV4G523_9GAST|nr:membrane receptor RagA [Elysia marginata]